MPATTRYSATFDCPYEEEPARPPANPRSRSQSLYNFANGSLSNHDGASAQNSTENTERIPTRSVVKSSTKPAHNPLQFVKTSMSPLYKQAEEQMKKAKEVKKTVEVLKEEEEWLSNLDDWKSRRRKLSEHVIRRQEEMKQIEQEEQLWLQQKKQTKTFSEMVEERTHRGRSLSLNLFSSPFEVDFFSNKSKSFFDESDECQEESEESKDMSSSNSVTSQPHYKSDKNGFSAQKRKTGNVKHNGEYPSVLDNHLDSSSSLEFSVDKGRESMTGLYTDSGLDSLSSSHRACEIVDSGSDFSQDSGGSSLESDITGLVTTGTELLEEYSSKKTSGVELFLRIPLNKTECKDFGFTFKHKKNEVVVDFVSPGSPSDAAGLSAQDRIITMNGKDARHLETEEIKCQLQNSVRTGSLDLLLCRPKALSNGIEHRNGSSEGVTKDKNKTVDTTLNTDSAKKTNQTSVKPKVSAVKRPPPIPAKPKLKPKEVKGATQKLDTDSESNDSEISEKIGRQSSLKERSIESENEMFVDDFEELLLLSNGASSVKQNSVTLSKKEADLSDKTSCKKVIVKSKLKTAQHTSSA